jgi:MFS family permease
VVPDAVSLQTRLIAAAAVRSLATGLVGVLLGLYLGQLGLDTGALGLVVGTGLAGIAAGTTVVAFLGDRWGRRRTLITTTLLSAAGLLAMARAATIVPLALAALLGMVNGMGRDRGPAQTLEQSLLADGVPDRRRTRAFTRYTLAQDLAAAAGALAAALPALVAGARHVPLLTATRWTFVGAGVVLLGSVPLYLTLPWDEPRPSRPSPGPWWRIPLSRGGRRRVGGLAGLFALDSLGGGFLAGAIVTFWFFRRFGLGGDVLGPVFFAARLLNATSYLAAEWLAARIGLVRTMVFTHLPSSAVLCALPLVPTAGAAIALFLLRESLVQMDVPARQSYISAVTAPGERTFALGVTGVVRNTGWAVGAPLGGLAMGAAGLGAPLVIGAGLKMVYDVGLFAAFRHVRAPEERPVGMSNVQ